MLKNLLFCKDLLLHLYKFDQMKHIQTNKQTNKHKWRHNFSIDYLFKKNSSTFHINKLFVLLLLLLFSNGCNCPKEPHYHSKKQVLEALGTIIRWWNVFLQVFWWLKLRQWPTCL